MKDSTENNDYETEFDPDSTELAEAADRLARVLFAGWTVGQISDLATGAADAGWPGLTYTSDLVDLYHAHTDDLWAHARDTAEEIGVTVRDMQGWSQNPREIDDEASLATWLVWLAAESIARLICPER